MKVVIGKHLAVRETGDLRRLSATSDLSPEELSSALEESGAGTYAGDHCWLKVAVLRALGPGEDEWRAGFDGMIAYAATRGWVAGDWVRVHFGPSSSG
ncbi:hypothetical protein G3I59_20680 [Amycolatopsis rubida]|uniref:Uncharacterized protein n=1 Tax=Amycolatopsis rubida TaxID=112413 RepID=A0A1I5ZFM1_9PSEU|nr:MULTISPECIES: hypothetical protein [Amycolatopsis]MYW92962.1 hypothetical protein [Amycolatopsis rubida]NEC57949.1 hypothetical protein [Amycolatopsis rubida]OAP25486.1 hypothetical protein A4R44_03870 [Amycolatopsis sp. M39]SFQ55183.1 hypothetical protein SAMN05421854_11520 [Amycolatopsis rubida]